jgi:hypothetical protein
MLSKKAVIGAVLFSSLLLSNPGLADWKQSVMPYWGASGTAYCHNYENISVWVGMSYPHHNDALTELWTKAVTVCLDKGGLYDVSGGAYSHKGLLGKRYSFVIKPGAKEISSRDRRQ